MVRMRIYVPSVIERRCGCEALTSWHMKDETQGPDNVLRGKLGPLRGKGFAVLPLSYGKSRHSAGSSLFLNGFHTGFEQRVRDDVGFQPARD
jgi:hypothetical protein